MSYVTRPTRRTCKDWLTAESAGGIIASSEIETASLVVAVVEARGTGALIAADRIATFGRTANLLVSAFVIVHALIPVTMLLTAGTGQTCGKKN